MIQERALERERFVRQAALDRIWDAWDPWAQTVGPVVRNPATGQFRPWAPCPCCGERCHSQLEFMRTNGGTPWRFCCSCDPGLDEVGQDTLCECRRARGDANWETEDVFARREVSQ